MNLLCQACGFHNPPGMRFCGNCGQRLPGPTTPLDPSHLSGSEPQGMLSGEQLGILVGADLLNRLQRAGLEARGQRRNVTILFADLSGFTAMAEQMDNEILYDVLQQFIRALVNNVYQFEGIVDKLTGDGLMALFGAPIAHENNAERAVLAALDMQSAIQSLNLELDPELHSSLHLRIGLHAGTVIVGGFGSNLMMDYTAIGDSVNLANRIEESAPPGAILVSESVYQQTRALFDYHQHATQKFKGIPNPVNTYQVLGQKQLPQSVRGIEGLHAPLVGRAEEITILQGKILEIPDDKSGRFILVTGEAGIGKSRLVSELRVLLRHTPIQVYEGQSLAYRRTVAYWIFRDLIYNYLGLPRFGSERQVAETLQDRLTSLLPNSPGAERVYLEHLLGLPYSDPDAGQRLAFLEAEQLRQRIFFTVRDLLFSAAHSQPVLVILDDLHWADEASLDLLQFLIDSGLDAPIGFIGITRPVQEGSLVNLVEHAQARLGSRYLNLGLTKLSASQSLQLISQLLTQTELPANLQTQIIHRASGIPFYLEELLRTLIDNDLLKRVEDSWIVVGEPDLKSLGVPETLQGLILARLDRLGPLERTLLQIASVIGNSFELKLLEAVYGAPDRQMIKTALEHLVRREFIIRESSAEQAVYRFRHMLMSEAIYQTILRRERAQLHGDIAAAIEKLFDKNLDDYIELLARHYLWSTRPGRALHYQILAGQRAARGYLNRQAQEHFENARKLLEQTKASIEQVIEIYSGLGDLLALAGEYVNAREYYLTAHRQVNSAGNNGFNVQSSKLQRKIATTYERQGDYERAIEYLERAQSILQAMNGNEPTEYANLLNELGWIAFRRGDLDQAETLLTDALNIIENSHQLDAIASIYNRLGGVYYQKDQLTRAMHFVRKSLVLREEIGDIVGVARSYNNLGLLGWRRGDWDSALDDFVRSLELNTSLGDIEGLVHLHSNIGLLQTDRGALAAAREHLEKSLQIAMQIGHTYLEGLACMHLSRYWLTIQDWDMALDYSQRSLDIFSTIGAHENFIDLYCSLGEAYLGNGDFEPAQQYCQKAVESLPEEELNTDVLPGKARIHRLQGEIYAHQGNPDLAREYLVRSAEDFTTSGNQLELGRTLLALAWLDRSLNKKPSFRMHLNEARLIFRKLGAEQDLAHARNLETI